MHHGIGHMVGYTSPPGHGTCDTHPLPCTWGLGYPSPSPFPLLKSGGHHWRPVQTCSFQDTHPLLLTPGSHHQKPVQTCSCQDTSPSPSPPVRSGNHRNTYGWQAGGTHPTEMLSCLIIFTFKLFSHTPKKALSLLIRFVIRHLVFTHFLGKETAFPLTSWYYWTNESLILQLKPTPEEHNSWPSRLSLNTIYPSVTVFSFSFW